MGVCPNALITPAEKCRSRVEEELFTLVRSHSAVLSPHFSQISEDFGEVDAVLTTFCDDPCEKCGLDFNHAENLPLFIDRLGLHSL